MLAVLRNAAAGLSDWRGRRPQSLQ